jgi:periplasmic protein TonB
MNLYLRFYRCFSIPLFILLLLVFYNSSFADSFFPNDEEYLIGAETMPTPVGGVEGIVKKINSMSFYRNTKVEGKVYLLAYINTNGEVDDVKIVKGIGGGCDEAAVEAVKKTKFAPGENGGKAVKVKMTLAIAFKAN